MLPPPYNSGNPSFAADLRQAVQAVQRVLRQARDGLPLTDLLALTPAGTGRDAKYWAQVMLCGVVELLCERKAHLWIVDRYTKPGVAEAELRVIPAGPGR
jgi:hypothetical protein